MSILLFPKGLIAGNHVDWDLCPPTDWGGIPRQNHSHMKQNLILQFLCTPEGQKPGTGLWGGLFYSDQRPGEHLFLKVDRRFDLV